MSTAPNWEAELAHTLVDARAAIEEARRRINSLVLQNDALRSTKSRLHAQLRAMRIARDGGSCETCKGRGYYGFTLDGHDYDDQPCPDCNPDGDGRDAP